MNIWKGKVGNNFKFVKTEFKLQQKELQHYNSAPVFANSRESLIKLWNDLHDLGNCYNAPENSTFLSISFTGSGSLGNSATLIILKFEKGMRIFTKMIFALQTVADLMWVTLQLIYQVYYLSLSPLINQFIIFILNSYIGCSLRCSAFVALERMCLVMWPTNLIIRRAAFKESVITCSSLVLFSAALSGICQFFIRYNDTWKVALDYIFNSFFPPLVSLISSSVFLYKIKTSTSKVNPNPQNQLNRPSVLPIKIVALSSICTFVVLMPMMCFNIKYVTYNFENKGQKLIGVNILSWFQTLWWSNFALKFFLYTIFIRHFRKGFVDICKKVKNKFIRNWNENIDKKCPQLESPGVEEIK